MEHQCLHAVRVVVLYACLLVFWVCETSTLESAMTLAMCNLQKDTHLRTEHQYLTLNNKTQHKCIHKSEESMCLLKDARTVWCGKRECAKLQHCNRP